MGHPILTDEVLSYGFPRPRTVWLWFAVPFVAAWALSFGWAWLVIFILEAKYDVPDARNSYSWGDGLMLLVGVFIGLWCFRSIGHQMERIANFTRILNSLGDLIDTVFENASDREILLSVALTDGAGGSMDITTGLAIHELVSMILVSGILLLWQYSSATPHLNEAYGIVDILSSDRDKYTGKVPLLFKSSRERSRDTYVSVTMLHLIKSRVEKWSMRDDHGLDFLLTLKQDTDISRPPDYFLHNRARITSSVSKVINDIHNAVVMEDLQVWDGIHIANKILGIIYLILLPGIIWPSQGRWIAVTYPVVFLFVGGLIAYNIFIGDVFQSPNTTHMTFVYRRLLDIETRANTSLMMKYTEFSEKLHGPHYFDIVHRFLSWATPSKSL